MTKSEIRTLYKQKRLALSSKERLRLDDLLLIQFQHFNFTGIQNVLTYWPMANTNEPNTHLFTGYLRHAIASLQLAYPVINSASTTMQAIAIDEHTVYAPNEYGIMEPKTKTVIKAAEIQLILMPLLAYDVNGYRVGYGKGYYDKFVATQASNAVLMGFSYFEPISNIADINEHDIPLHFCITPHTIYEFE